MQAGGCWARYTRADGCSPAQSLVTRHHHFPGSHCLVTICSSLSEMGTCLQDVMVLRECCLCLKRGEGEKERGDREGREER